MSTFRPLTSGEEAFVAGVYERWRGGLRELPATEFDRVRELFTRWPMLDESQNRVVNGYQVFVSSDEPREHLMFKGEPLLRANA
jgi:hypothetical protein